MKMRRMDRLVSDRARIGRIIADSAVCRVAVKDEEGLYIVPLSFGYVYEGETLPPDFVCPWCKHGAADFEPVT